jgi:O-antigen/teichoic acid export membrane protein
VRSEERGDSLWRRQFGTSVFWNGTSSALMQGGAFLGNIASARVLGPESFGQLAIVTTTMIAVAGLAQLATGNTATKFTAELADRDPERASRVLTLCRKAALYMGAAASVLIILLSNTIAEGALGASELTVSLALAAIYIVSSVVAGFSTGALTGLHSFRSLAVISSVQGVLHVILCVLGAYLYSIQGVVVAWGISMTVRMLLSDLALVRACRERGLKLDAAGFRKEMHVIHAFAIPAALAGVVSLVAVWLAAAIVVRQPDGFLQMGLFGAASNLKTLILFLPLVVDGVCLAMLNRERGAGNSRAFRRVFWSYLLVSCGIGSLLALLAIVFAGPLMSAFGPEFADGREVLAIFAIATLLQIFATAWYQLIQTSGRMWLSLFAVALPRDLLLVGLAVWLVPERGALGLALAHAVAWSCALAVIVSVVWRLKLLNTASMQLSLPR